MESQMTRELEQFRRDKDRFFTTHPQSPLTPVQRSRFAGLAYYEERPDLVIEAELEPVEGEKVTMATSTGTEQVYRRAGRIGFEVEGRRVELTLFQSDASEDLFLPFRDQTSGKETYGAGRYLEVEPPRDGRVVVDFNYAYNPYCAYNEGWTCPLPPTENWLPVPIRAGERDFQERPNEA